jgi:hypothetical protein
MQYTLLIRALLDIEQKEKAEAHLARLFPETDAGIDGRYWKDKSLWEANIRFEREFSDDQAALWQTMVYLRGAASFWTITGPHDPSFDAVVAGVCNEDQKTGLRWCSFELLRGSIHCTDENV